MSYDCVSVGAAARIGDLVQPEKDKPSNSDLCLDVHAIVASHSTARVCDCHNAAAARRRDANCNIYGCRSWGNVCRTTAGNDLERSTAARSNAFCA